MERFIVVDNVCGWPKLTLMNDGSINMDIHNKPQHGSDDGSAVCYKSVDEGRSFEKIGVSGKGSMEDGAFIDKSCGCAHNGDYIVIAQNSKLKKTLVFRSKDGGKTFDVTGEIASGRENCSNHGAMPFPYGVIQKMSDKKLVFHYWMNTEADWGKGYADAVHEAHVCFSYDDGYTWTEDYKIADGINETAILFYDDLNAIAISRCDTADNTGRRDAGKGNSSYITKDGGKTWEYTGPAFGVGMLPAHLIETKDGETLATFGYRFANQYGVMACISKDHGSSWTEPTILVQYQAIDGGYPSTVQLDDGSLITAYYCAGHMYHTRYHVGVIRWTKNDLVEGRWVGRPAKFYYGTDEEVIYDCRIL